MSVNTTMPVVAMALATISADADGLFLKYGYVRDDSWNWTIGAVSGLIYASETAGEMSQSAPGSGGQLQEIGYGYSVDIMFFNPQYGMLEI